MCLSLLLQLSVLLALRGFLGFGCSLEQLGSFLPQCTSSAASPGAVDGCSMGKVLSARAAPWGGDVPEIHATRVAGAGGTSSSPPAPALSPLRPLLGIPLIALP